MDMKDWREWAAGVLLLLLLLLLPVWVEWAVGWVDDWVEGWVGGRSGDWAWAGVGGSPKAAMAARVNSVSLPLTVVG